MSIYYIKSLDTFTYSISYLVHIIVRSGFKIKHDDDKTTIYNRENTWEVSHDTIKKYLADNNNYKSYNLFLRAYNLNKDKQSTIAKIKTIESLNLINRMVYIYAVKQIYTELQENNLITLTAL